MKVILSREMDFLLRLFYSDKENTCWLKILQKLLKGLNNLVEELRFQIPFT